MALSKIKSESLDLTDNYDFTGTVTGAGETNAPSFKVVVSTSPNNFKERELFCRVCPDGKVTATA